MVNSVKKALKSSKKALTIDEIAEILYLTSDEEKKELKDTIDNLLNSYDVYKTSGDKFLDIDNSPYKKGTYRISKDGKGRIVQF